MLSADSISVPEHNSSPNTRLFSSDIFNIIRNSDISTANVDNPLNILSFPRMRENIAVYGLYRNCEQGTNKPDCAIITDIPSARMKLVLPTAFVPYNKNPFMSSSIPTETSFATYSSFC